MRVIAGIAKGHKLKSVEGRTTRPTSDRIKESLFNILSNEIFGASFLDLYAGTGSIGIEALSRGSKTVAFVDDNPQCINIINENLVHTKLAAKADVIKSDAIIALDRFARSGYEFDIIFVDPPYGKYIPDVILNRIAGLGVLRPNGIVVVEKATKDSIGQQFGTLVIKDVRSYGDTQLVFFGV